MITPFDFQKEATNRTFRYLNQETGNGLICMPTGTGKSVTISDLIFQIMMMQPYRRIMVLTHVWKLIEQNVQRLLQFWPNAPVGIHSAGLDKRDYANSIIFGGVQSVVKNTSLFGLIDLLLIDEAHLLSANDDSQYGEVIGILKAKNPNLRIIGYTATPYRLKMGMLTDGGIFQDIIYDITDFESFNRLIAEGHLAPLIGKPTDTVIENLDKLKLVGGDYNQKQAEQIIDTEKVVYSAVNEIIQYGQQRGTWMLFAAGVGNAEHLAMVLRECGISAACVHSKLSDKENRDRLKDYDSGYLRAIVGANMLTTGYDNTKIDLIADLQPTLSPGKHVQKLGRGTRVHRGSDYYKPNCLVLDFVGNIRSNGPINDPRKPRKPGEPTGAAPIKICETPRLIQPDPPAMQIVGCKAYNHASARYCCNCAAEFNFQTKIYESAKNDSPMKVAEEPKYETVPVSGVTYSRHPGKEGKFSTSPDSVKVSYKLGLRTINKFLCFEHAGYPRHIAHDWWKKHHHGEPPATVADFLSSSDYGELRIPKYVVVHANKEYPEIVGYEF